MVAIPFGFNILAISWNDFFNISSKNLFPASKPPSMLEYATISFDLGVNGVIKSSGYKSPILLLSQT
jgi:hypothetical protein